MSEAESETDVEMIERLSDEIVDALDRLLDAVAGGEEGADIVEVAQDLWEVLDEFEDVLDQIDLSEALDAVDVEELPEVIELENLPEAIEDAEASELIDVRALEQAITFRELWDAVDLTQTVQEARELDEETDELEETLTDEDEEEESDMLDMGLDDGDMMDMDLGADDEGIDVDMAAKEAVIQEKLMEAVEAFRAAVLEAHKKMYALVEHNKERFGRTSGQPSSLNPSAYSSMPRRSVSAVSTANNSTVPQRVRHSGADNKRRIYGKRFRDVREDDGGGDEDEDENEGDGEAEAESEGENDAESESEEISDETDANGGDDE